MYESPQSLEELCLNCVCDNIRVLVRKYRDDNHKWYSFIDKDLFLIQEISEKLLMKFDEKKLLCDPLMYIFNADNTRLANVRLRNSKVSQGGLKILGQHKITYLECVSLKNTSIGNILDCLNEWSFANMIAANFTKCTFIDIQRHSLMVKITNLRHLKLLNLSGTELNQMSFQMICHDLVHLECLDVSGTNVKDLSPLLLLAERLISLSISDLSQTKNYVETLSQLVHLRHLDVSILNEKLSTFHLSEPPLTPVANLLDNNSGGHNSFPNLLSLDLSGWRDLITSELVQRFLNTHPHIQFLGLVLTDVELLLANDCHGNEVTVAGLADERQIKVALMRYRDRSTYVQKALYHLFQLTNTGGAGAGGDGGPGPDIFQLVVEVMAEHPSKFGVQMAATACLYNLTRGELSKRIHPTWLARAVNLTLFAMECFPDEFQLQKNSLLTLCSDTILQEINFDRFRCAKLVLDALCAFEDVNMNRMAVAICSILAAKVSTEETSELGARPVYMRKLLSMVQNRVSSGMPDITLKFTLSALWNLTDESAATCTVFLEQGGATLFLDVLRKFKGDSAIETKVLGLLNNIAEVATLRRSLMSDDLIDQLHLLVQSKDIDVSYFAAGIVAHLASDGAEQWTLNSRWRDDMLSELESAVLQWKIPDSEMVAYRSFRPFFPLLQPEMDYQVQLWAVWAIHHVCTKNPKRYCVMLREEHGNSLLSNLVKYSHTDPEIVSICQQILETVERNKQ